MWESVSPLYRDRGLLRSGARRRRHVTLAPTHEVSVAPERTPEDGSAAHAER